MRHDKDFLRQIRLWSLIDRAFPYINAALIVITVGAIIWRLM